MIKIHFPFCHNVPVFLLFVFRKAISGQDTSFFIFRRDARTETIPIFATQKNKIVMLDLLREIFISDAGSFGFVFALLAFAGFAIHYITRSAAKIYTEHGVFAKRMAKKRTVEEAGECDPVKDNLHT
ncbi:MAG: hypothetical protein LBJ01_10485 [Tannerella sp.]|jgi:hypothetical protein|nr:hypothetical protein [Tannerella sp.]